MKLPVTQAAFSPVRHEAARRRIKTSTVLSCLRAGEAGVPRLRSRIMKRGSPRTARQS